jgi:hypothetical protein
MTSKTGKTEMTLVGTREPPTFGLAMFGAVAQLATLSYVWFHHTPAQACMLSPWACLTDPGAAHPFGRNIIFCLAQCVLLWLYSVAKGRTSEGGTSDPSIVDRLWSILPALYVLHFMLSAPGGTPPTRLVIMTVLSTCWGSRLTWNFWRKGGFTGGEDYRWVLVRQVQTSTSLSLAHSLCHLRTRSLAHSPTHSLTDSLPLRTH